MQTGMRQRPMIVRSDWTLFLNFENHFLSLPLLVLRTVYLTHRHCSSTVITLNEVVELNYEKHDGRM